MDQRTDGPTDRVTYRGSVNSRFIIIQHQVVTIETKKERALDLRVWNFSDERHKENIYVFETQ